MFQLKPKFYRIMVFYYIFSISNILLRDIFSLAI